VVSVTIVQHNTSAKKVMFLPRLDGLSVALLAKAVTKLSWDRIDYVWRWRGFYLLIFL